MNFDDEMPTFGRSNRAFYTPLELAEQAKAELAAWLDDHPVITNDDEREAKAVFDRAKSSYGDLEQAREAATKPLHEAWQTAIALFKPTITAFGRSIDTLNDRMQLYLRDKKRKADEAAAAAAIKAAEAERLAREAEAKERAALDDASQGVIGAGVDGAVAAANKAFEDYQRASREAARAEREAHVKIAGGFSGRAMGLRTEKMQVLDDVHAAIKDMGVTDDIKAAVLKSARAFKKVNNRWPAGVREETL